MNLEEELFKLQDKNYQLFQKKLCPRHRKNNWNTNTHIKKICKRNKGHSKN